MHACRNRQTAGDREFGSQQIDLHFYVLVSKHFKFNPTAQSIEIRSEKLFGDYNKGASLGVQK